VEPWVGRSRKQKTLAGNEKTIEEIIVKIAGEHKPRSQKLPRRSSQFVYEHLGIRLTRAISFS